MPDTGCGTHPPAGDPASRHQAPERPCPGQKVAPGRLWHGPDEPGQNSAHDLARAPQKPNDGHCPPEINERQARTRGRSADISSLGTVILETLLSKFYHKAYDDLKECIR